MKGLVRNGFVLAAVAATGFAGYWAGQRSAGLPATAWLKMPAWLGGAPSPLVGPASPPTGPVIYYRDPDDRPSYSATPARTADGRAYTGVHASEDVRLDEPAPAPALARSVLYYRNPMGLPDTSPVPKKDSMGMDYVPVYADEGAEAGTVKVAAGKLQQTGVRTAIAERRSLVRPLRIPGSIELDERRVSVIAMRADAFLTRIEAVTTGERIAKGQPLLQLYSPEIAAASALFLTELGAGRLGGAGGGARQRLENLGVPPETITELERTRKVPSSLTWRAPRDGIVLERNASEGMKASQGDILFRIADISSVWVLADLPEYELGAVRQGATARISLRGLPGKTFEGRVSLLYPEVARQTRTVRVRIELANPEGLLRPQMYADVEIATGGAAEVVTVPDSAVIDSGTSRRVILAKGDGRFEPREVRTGAQGSGFTEIREGLTTGDRVVVAATFLIDAESNLKAALGGLAPPEAMP